MKITIQEIGADDVTVLAEPDLTRVPCKGEMIDLSEHGTPWASRRIFEVVCVTHAPMRKHSVAIVVVQRCRVVA